MLVLVLCRSLLSLVLLVSLMTVVDAPILVVVSVGMCCVLVDVLDPPYGLGLSVFEVAHHRLSCK